MTRYVALLRAINLGATNRIAMPALRTWVAELGHTDVTTYIASGNVVFTAATDGGDEALAGAIAGRIATETGLHIDVLVRSHAELVEAIERNPFPDAPGARLQVAFLATEPGPEAVAGLNTVESGRDELQVIGRVAFLSTPDGQGRSKLAVAFGKRIGVISTARNLNTVRKLVDLSSP